MKLTPQHKKFLDKIVDEALTKIENDYMNEVEMDEDEVDVDELDDWRNTCIDYIVKELQMIA